VLKGAVSLFFKWSDLGSGVHVTDAEVDDAYNVCNQIKLAFNRRNCYKLLGSIFTIDWANPTNIIFHFGI
jgi:hypothetical protein